MKKRWNGYTSVFFALAISAFVMLANVSAAENVDTLEESREAASAELDELEQQLSEVMVQLDQIECDLIEKRLELDELELEYEETSELLRVQYEEMKLRIQYMYENSTGGQAGLLLSSENPAQLLNRAEYIQNISMYDRARLEEYAGLAERVKGLQQELEGELELQERLQEALVQKQQELNELIEEKKEEIGDINSKILTAMEAAKKEREEAQRKAAEAASKARELERRRREEQESREAASREAASQEAASREAASREAASQEAASREAASQEAATAATEETTEEKPVEMTTEAATAAPTEEETQAPANTGMAADVVSMAYQLIGTRYLAGGASPAGFDCSGFTYYLYSQAGISIPRTSSGQALGGVKVDSLEEAVPGDIICYPGHVGLYVGNGQIIHATVPGSTVKLAPVIYSSWQTVVAIRRYQ